MNYIKITFPVADVRLADELTARLAEINFEGFEETEAELMGYIAANELNETALMDISREVKMGYQKELIPAQNWNASWESNFDPVMIDGFCSIRADFHLAPIDVLYDIVITPKMSFGTGHHATTALMISLMRGLDFKGRKVLDYGTGTGILAILAAQMGALTVLAIDNDDWAVANSLENCARNSVTNVVVEQGTLEQLSKQADYAIVLANINRNVLIASMEQLYNLLQPGSTLLLSGILEEDTALILEVAEREGFRLTQQQGANGWMALQLDRP